MRPLFGTFLLLLSLAGAHGADTEPPQPPKGLVLTYSSFTTIRFDWDAASDNVGVEEYVIYDKSNQISSTSETSIIVPNLDPETQYSFSVAAVDAAGNQSPRSEPLVVSTTVLVDSFEDKDTLASYGWGEWKVSHDGTAKDGLTRLEFDAEGFDGSAAQLFYTVDSGEWGFANLYLDFNEGGSVDLTQSGIVGLRFKMSGRQGSRFNVQLGTPLAQWNWMYYRFTFEATSEWTQVELILDRDFYPSETGIPYTVQDAMKNMTSLVFETTDVGTSGWLVIDEVEFTTPTSTVNYNANAGSSDGSGRTRLTIFVSFGLSVLFGWLLLW